MRGLALALLACAPESIFGLTTTVTTVLSGLKNPRGIAFGPEGSLYVAEAGSGGDGPCQTGDRGQTCFGTTGAITRLWPGKNNNQPPKHERVVTGLPSVAAPDGSEASGVQDLGFQGGALFAVIGGVGPVANRVGFGAAASKLASLVQITGHTWKLVADLGAFEVKNNPDGGALESNPFGLLVDGNAKIIADASGNTLLQVLPNGQVSNLAVFAEVAGVDAVPTTAAKGNGNTYYVSQLTGAPFTDGAASIWKVVPGSAPTKFREGFSRVTDMAFAPNGDLFVLEYAFGAPGGRIVKLAPDNTRTVVHTGLSSPTSIALDQNGAIYVSTHGSSATAGEVIKIVVSP